MAKQKYDYDLLVLGSGGGGSVAALIAAGAGKRVAMVESPSFEQSTDSAGFILRAQCWRERSVPSTARSTGWRRTRQR